MTALSPSPPAASVTSAEIATQPELWDRACALAGTTAGLLPRQGESAVAIGCGTSHYIGDSWARLRTATGGGRTRALIASEVPYVEDPETVLAISRSGTTLDLLRALADVRGRHRIVGITGTIDAPLTDICDEVIDLGFADETSVVQTRFATTVLVLLRACLGEDVSGLADAARDGLELALPAELPRHLVFLGTGWTLGLAQEAALKCREASGSWTEAYAVREYQHGPIAVAGPMSLVWSFSPLEPSVRQPIEATGATVITHDDLDPMGQLVAAQRLALALAAAAGRNPDTPQHLARSVQA